MPSHHPRACDRSILAWDGEGWEDSAGNHVYGYFANSDGEELYDAAGLTTDACLSLLWETGHDRLNVVFSGSYDATLILKDLSPEQARDAMSDDTPSGFVKGCRYEGYIIRYVPRKYLYIRREEAKRGIILWDIWGFFQGSFIAALEKWFGKEYDDLSLIHEGKALRSVFDPSDIEFIRRYNSAELRALVRLMETFLDAVEKAGLTLSRFDGAGAVAAAMLKKHGVKERVFLDETGAKIRLPMEMRLAAEIGYYGGRIEAFQYGRAGATIYHYDINSAYPAALVNLPNIGRGAWSHQENPVFSRCPEMTLFRVQWDVGNEKICPFPYRSKMQRKILYPSRGESWVWYPEVFAALNAARPGWSIRLLEAWVFTPDDEEDLPYSWIQDYYDTRARMIKEKNGAEKVIKLGLNSLYGKTAQRVGAKPFHNLAYAGYITSYTRAMLYTAGMHAPHAIIAFATDGVFSLAPLPLPCPEEKILGQWEGKKHDDMVIVQSGHYILKDGKSLKLWSRGFDKFVGTGKTEKARERDYQNKVKLYWKTLIDAWKRGEWRIYLPCTRFVTLKAALIGERWQYRGQWKPGHDPFLPGKELKIIPFDTKREIDKSLPQPSPSRALVSTLPTENYTPGEMSAPYRSLDEDDTNRAEMEDEQIAECLIR